MPVLILLLAILAIGVGMLLSALYVRFRDIQPIWEVASQMLFYASPIIYPAIRYKGFIHIAMINPIAAILVQMQAAWIGSSTISVAGRSVTYTPIDASQAIGGTVRLLIPLGIIAGMFCLGLWFFNREAPRIAENL